MLSRKLSKRVELWQTTNVPDGFGGNIESEELITSFWAEIRTVTANSKSNRSTDNGITSTTNTIIIKTRLRKDLDYNSINQFLKYSGSKYVVSNEPYNVDFNNSYIEIVATKQQIKSVPIINPI